MNALLIALVLLATPVHAADLHSGYADESKAIQAMQDDDDANPAQLWVLQGEQAWDDAPAPGVKSCMECHGKIASMKGVAARYPVWDAARNRAITLPDRVNLCRTEKQGLPALGRERETMLGLTAAIGKQSRGLPISVATSGPLAEIGAQGQAVFFQRQGQLDLSCADCHNDLAGRSLGGATIPQGHPNGYPLYRLEWQQLGSLQRRIRNCLTGMRADTYRDDSPEMQALEVYLAQRANGMKIETPAVRP